MKNINTFCVPSVVEWKSMNLLLKYVHTRTHTNTHTHIHTYTHTHIHTYTHTHIHRPSPTFWQFIEHNNYWRPQCTPYIPTRQTDRHTHTHTHTHIHTYTHTHIHTYTHTHIHTYTHTHIHTYIHTYISLLRGEGGVCLSEKFISGLTRIRIPDLLHGSQTSSQLHHQASVHQSFITK